MILWARKCKPPSWLRKSRSRGAKAQGLRYEKSFGKALPEALHGQWFEYDTPEGVKWCQTDYILSNKHGYWIFECKYTWTPDAIEKLREVYIPVVKMALLRPAAGIVVCKNVLPETGLIVDNLLDACRIAADGHIIPCLQWLPQSRLVPQEPISTTRLQAALARPHEEPTLRS